MPLVPAAFGLLVALTLALGWGCWHLLESRGEVKAELKQAEATNVALAKQLEDAAAERERVDALVADRTKLSRALSAAAAVDRRGIEDARNSDAAVGAWADALVPGAIAQRLQQIGADSAGPAIVPAPAAGAP